MRRFYWFVIDKIYVSAKVSIIQQNAKTQRKNASEASRAQKEIAPILLGAISNLSTLTSKLRL